MQLRPDIFPRIGTASRWCHRAEVCGRLALHAAALVSATYFRCDETVVPSFTLHPTRRGPHPRFVFLPHVLTPCMLHGCLAHIVSHVVASRSWAGRCRSVRCAEGGRGRKVPRQHPQTTGGDSYKRHIRKVTSTTRKTKTKKKKKMTGGRLDRNTYHTARAFVTIISAVC